MDLFIMEDELIVDEAEGVSTKKSGKKKRELSEFIGDVKKQLETVTWISDDDAEAWMNVETSARSLGPNMFISVFGFMPCVEIEFDYHTLNKALRIPGFVELDIYFSHREGMSISAWVDKRHKIVVRGGSDRTPPTIQFFPAESNKEYILNLIAAFQETYLKEKHAKKKNLFGIIVKCNFSGELRVRSMPCKPKEISDYKLFYGDDFPYDKILDFANAEESLLLLHGPPGTGKSNFIKNMLDQWGKEVIYIPPNMLTLLSSPDFIPFLLDQKGKVLLIEDAEEILSSDRNSATNNLLGATDGFLKDALDIKIICTFNTDLNNIDKALKRKGRMYFEYKFDALSSAEANRLAEHLKLGTSFSEPATLAQIFNQAKNSETLPEKRAIGFGAF